MGQDLAGANHPDGRHRRSANTPQAGEILKISGSRNVGAGLVIRVAISRAVVTFQKYQSSICSANRCRRSSMRSQRIG
jgi:hypothetical protein